MNLYTNPLYEAAIAFRRALRGASEAELEKVQAYFARNTMESDYASSHEPDAGISLSMQAELQQRWMNAKDQETEEEIES
jgi:hypothetical protein